MPALQTRSNLIGVATVLAILLALRPAPLSARQATTQSDGTLVSPAERAVTGGIAVLRSPRSTQLLLRAASFRMGSSIPQVLDAVADCARESLGHRCREELFSDELEAHSVSLSAFWLDRHEVTVSDYARCVAVGRCRSAPFAEGARRFDVPNYPQSLVAWEDARDYCRFRGARLPTEAEFERAARGPTGRRFPWGNLWNSKAANHGRLGLDVTNSRDGFAELAPVGSFPAGRTPEGLLDLGGNVAEWTRDLYAPSYPAVPVKDPKGPQAGTAGSERVVRGGHFGQAPPWLRGAARGRAEPSYRSPTVGFRCARSASRN